MSEAYYQEGCTIELDSSVPRLTIEGRKVPVEKVDELFVYSELPGIKTKTLFELAQKIIDRSLWFNRRKEAQEIHLAKLKEGVTEWNKWRLENPTIRPLLYNCNLTKEELLVELEKADFSNAVLIEADLNGQNLKEANFHEANLGGAKLHGADLTKANFCRTDLYKTEMSKAILNDANLQGAQLAKTNFEEAHLNGCKVYGASAWDLKLEGAEQGKIIIRYLQENTGKNAEGNNESEITVESLEDAQLLFLFLNNPKIHGVLESVTSKIVLILGRFTEERKSVLDALRTRLRAYNFVPIVFDFEKPTRRDLTETISMLAHMAYFVIADITDAKSIPQELQKIVPNLPSLPVRPIILENQYEYGMFEGFGGYLSVLSPYRYQDTDQLLGSLEEKVIDPALSKAKEISERRSTFEKELEKR